MKFNVKDIIAVFMKYVFYAILVMIGAGFIAAFSESGGSSFFKISSSQIFRAAVYTVCLAPAVSVALFTVLNILKKDWKSSFLGICLVFALLASFFIKNTG